MPPADMTQVVEEVTHSMSQNEAFMHHLQQVRGSTSSCRLTDEMLVMEDVTPGKIQFVISKKAVFKSLLLVIYCWSHMGVCYVSQPQMTIAIVAVAQGKVSLFAQQETT